MDELDDIIKVQKDNITDQYMRGLYNGLVLAKSCMTGLEPKYLDKDYKPEYIGTDVMKPLGEPNAN